MTTPLITQVHLKEVTDRLKSAAQRVFVTEAPVYSKTNEEALLRALPNAQELLASNLHAVLYFADPPKNVVVTLSISVDAYEAEKRWHVSMSRAGAALFPTRVPDKFSSLIINAFDLGLVEGPPEGASKLIRHFFAPYRPG